MNFEEIKEKVKIKFKDNPRYKHMEEVVNMALKLNHQFGVDVEKIKLAGILHDYTKEMTLDESVAYLTKYLSNEELLEAKKYPSVIHSITAYYAVQIEFGITDEDILKAILYHTTGNPHMTKLQELIFVADAIEETRTYNGVEEIRKAVLEDFYQGMLLMMEKTLTHLKEKGWYINPKTQETYDYYWRIYGINK
ncbi:MAG: bis(5'-nucleosyl)-tetraphosphatase (symmetrical) YqeK [Bacilli bacterium]|nr:bis(5'-nucleosyl)-tetraphosphatase (symmetrical) YqeK [Bacilli bacterium]